ncbi:MULTISPECIES: class I SAM-dependent methyltransferase [Flavobacteriaceae]|uniref:Class I SAM-dependent methyltransferase n=2 Tax=Flavobacteriaceae TaxID=49546 RepID=A0A4Y8AQG0_9FLAO|nr:MULTISPECIES: class I SAM-dependent methyltransferase [Flavobacteriaceae]TEW72064.1 class I SAM-dependent methyltransferase [Gramella jeungdoensis]GGK56136.1 type 12 methyltransferase [Lutibacter litoralis]
MNYIDINKKLWNQKTEIHYNSDFYDIDSFIKGKDSLNPVEIGLLGKIKGKRILHLQCHFGQDTISLARHGALPTGIDFSENAIEKAKKLNESLDAKAKFIQSDIYNLPEILDEKFDIVFTSYGVIGWLPDMSKWAEIIKQYLKPGGEFIMVEFHPIVWMFSDDFKQIEFNYMDSAPIIEELEGTYTDRDAQIKEKSVSWNHGLSTVIDSLIKTGLLITDFKEHNYSPYDCFENTVKIDDSKFQIRGLENKIPMIYSLKAVKG